MRRHMNAAPVALLCLLEIVGTSLAQSTIEPRTDRYGSDYRHLDVAQSTPADCMKACLGDRRCRAWSYVRAEDSGGPVPQCWLKDAVPAAQGDDCCTSGIIQ
jgi:hypothetical protein